MKRSLLAGALLTALLLGACGTREPVTLTETDCRTAAVAADFSITLLRNAAKPDKTARAAARWRRWNMPSAQRRTT